MNVPPLFLFEDDHLLVINKPPGINTHAASPHSSDGIYDWLRNRSPDHATLSIHQRLDQETSGVLLFGKTREANQSLAKQFEERTVQKTYLLLTDRDPGQLPRKVRSNIFKAGGNDFQSSSQITRGQNAETEFTLVEQTSLGWLIEARPLTGRTHQIRIHARDSGFPILGDSLYEGTLHSRLCLHAHKLRLQHPTEDRELELTAPIDFERNPHVWLRQALWPEAETDSWRLIHGTSSNFPGWYVDRLGDYLLSQSASDLSPTRQTALENWVNQLGLLGVYHKQLDRHIRKSQPGDVSPHLIIGKPAPQRFEIKENGVRYSMSFEEGYSVGLFLDQKDNRNRLLSGHLFPQLSKGVSPPAPPDSRCCRAASRQSQNDPEVSIFPNGTAVLNTFAYTCGFSVCAAKAGATVTSIDLSKKYLDWGRDNFRLNDIDPDEHDFIFGDCFDWMKRLAKKGRQFDIVLLDPPTFSKSKKSGVFKADKDYGRLITESLALLKPNGILFASTNCSTLKPEDFLTTVRSAIQSSGRKLVQEFFATQSPDFPTSREEPGYLKTVWLRVL